MSQGGEREKMLNYNSLLHMGVGGVALFGGLFLSRYFLKGVISIPELIMAVLSIGLILMSLRKKQKDD